MSLRFSLSDQLLDLSLDDELLVPLAPLEPPLFDDEPLELLSIHDELLELWLFEAGFLNLSICKTNVSVGWMKRLFLYSSFKFTLTFKVLVKELKLVDIHIFSKSPLLLLNSLVESKLETKLSLVFF
ncbi:hypothetical protein FOY74_01030 [Mycoplasma capricolum subsp. capripneumoniae]|nr:hypothetical protein [Mycoplasma capricolum]QIN47009.1 hypothetical protein FOY69_01035 [Mycoplasma capricolum subsp. capripneumoniae]QIN48388.1 hypothetical protein FOY71_01030 [Mycoplasma capricolum subsp. capripneumoniae]QIN49072.1 hypothetical protein FOY73_01030 [Mycoplasma capricolum subsp. capripneumoniae]QIN49760.1 hypothetical protein FOY74_01030 [Mycoplasma capricolum subsp. capripneumoniae]CEA11605.1 hypothetical protein MCCPF38_00239 [Mycoplasma capricolum subsp. capripneumoniae